jgi:AraC-like DNA-binding protein
LAGVLLFFNWKVNRNALFLSLLMVLIATAQVRQYLVLHATEPFWLALFLNSPAPLWSMTGACLYFYVRSVLTDRLTFRKSDWLHTLPFWVNLVGTLPYILTPFSYKLEVANMYIHNMPAAVDAHFNWFMGNEVNLLLRYSIQIGYALVCLWMVAKFQQRHRHSADRPSSQSRMIVPWLVAVSVFVLLVGIYFFVRVYMYFKHPTLARNLASVYKEVHLIGVVLTFLPSLVLVFPEILYGIPRQRAKQAASIPPASAETAPVSEGAEPTGGSEIAETGAEATATSVEAVAQTEEETQTTADPMQELGRRVLTLMERDKPYLNPDFSIEQLADMLEVPRHHVYYCFKNVLKTKFVSMRTEYRVNEAKMRLLEADLEQTTLYAIGRSCGFSSHSAFYRIFNEVVGCSPGEFIERSKER